MSVGVVIDVQGATGRRIGLNDRIERGVPRIARAEYTGTNVIGVYRRWSDWHEAPVGSIGREWHRVCRE